MARMLNKDILGHPIVTALIGVVLTFLTLYMTFGTQIVTSARMHEEVVNVVNIELQRIVTDAVTNAMDGRGYATQDQVKQMIKENSPYNEDRKAIEQSLDFIKSNIAEIKLDMRDILAGQRAELPHRVKDK